MKSLYVLTGLNVLVWGGLIFLGYIIIDGVITPKIVGYTNSDQAIYYLYIPMLMATISIGAFLLSRYAILISLLLFIQAILLLGFFPYIMAYTGGSLVRLRSTPPTNRSTIKHASFYSEWSSHE